MKRNRTLALVVAAAVAFTSVSGTHVTENKTNKENATGNVSEINKAKKAIGPSDMEVVMAKYIERKKKEARQEERYRRLRGYLERYGSPLAPYAKDFVDAGDHYGVDYRIVIAVAGREQTFGVNWPGSSNNFWGYGSYCWPDIQAAAWEITRLYSIEYQDLSRGDICGAAKRYAESETWASGVTEFYEELKVECPE